MPNAGIATYYDRLSRWNAAARVFGYGGGRDALTVHRPLADPLHHGRPTTTRLHDILVEHLPKLSGALALDAGCGMGGTMLDLAPRLGCRFVGLTLSDSQAAIAARAARDQQPDLVEVLVGNYDQPPPGPFALIVAIESLAHSPNPGASLVALSDVLAPGGLFAIVDDMPEASARQSPDLETFMSGWSCPSLLSHDAYRRALEQLGLELVAERDLTSECRPRSQTAIARLMRLNRVIARGVPSRGIRAVMDSHLGGLALERLTRNGLVHYRLLLARRPLAFG